MSESTEESAERARQVELWIERARKDLCNCDALMAGGVFGRNEGVCFHAEQCVEKLVKAMSVWRNVSFEFSHHVPRLIASLPPDDRPPLSARTQQDLRSYAVNARYSLDLEFSDSDAADALQAARRTLEFVTEWWTNFRPKS